MTYSSTFFVLCLSIPVVAAAGELHVRPGLAVVGSVQVLWSKRT